MKNLIMLVAFVAAAASLTAGKYDAERPDWAPIEPNVEPNNQDHKGNELIQPRSKLETRLYFWAKKHQVVSQYNPAGLNATFRSADRKLNAPRVTALTAAAPNTLTEEDQAEVDELNRLLTIERLKQEQVALQHPRRDLPVDVVVDTKQVQLDTIEELKETIAALQTKLEERQQVVVNEKDDDSLSTPVVAAMAGLGGISLASLFMIPFMRRSVVA